MASRVLDVQLGVALASRDRREIACVARAGTSDPFFTFKQDLVSRKHTESCFTFLQPTSSGKTRPLHCVGIRAQGIGPRRFLKSEPVETHH